MSVAHCIPYAPYFPQAILATDITASQRWQCGWLQHIYGTVLFTSYQHITSLHGRSLDQPADGVPHGTLGRQCSSNKLPSVSVLFYLEVTSDLGYASVFRLEASSTGLLGRHHTFIPEIMIQIRNSYIDAGLIHSSARSVTERLYESGRGRALFAFDHYDLTGLRRPATETPHGASDAQVQTCIWSEVSRSPCRSGIQRTA